jgi:hypothetical protein
MQRKVLLLFLCCLGTVLSKDMSRTQRRKAVFGEDFSPVDIFPAKHFEDADRLRPAWQTPGRTPGGRRRANGEYRCDICADFDVETYHQPLWSRRRNKGEQNSGGVSNGAYRCDICAEDRCDMCDEDRCDICDEEPVPEVPECDLCHWSIPECDLCTSPTPAPTPNQLCKEVICEGGVPTFAPTDAAQATVIQAPEIAPEGGSFEYEVDLTVTAQRQLTTAQVKRLWKPSQLKRERLWMLMGFSVADAKRMMV